MRLSGGFGGRRAVVKTSRGRPDPPGRRDARRGARGPFDAVRRGAMGSRGARRTGPPGAAGVSRLRFLRRSRSGTGPVRRVHPRPEHGPEGRGAAGERERYPAAQADEPDACAEHALAQASQAPAGAVGVRHDATCNATSLVESLSLCFRRPEHIDPIRRVLERPIGGLAGSERGPERVKGSPGGERRGSRAWCSTMSR